MSKNFVKADNSESLCEKGVSLCSKDWDKLSQCSDSENWGTDSDTQNEDYMNTVQLHNYNCRNNFLVLPLSNKRHLISKKFENLYESVEENLGEKDQLQSTTCNENDHKILSQCSGSVFCDNSGNKNSMPRRILGSDSMLQHDNLLAELNVFSENRNTHQGPGVHNFNYVDNSNLENINVVCTVHITRSFFPVKNTENRVFSEDIFMERIIPTTILSRYICVNPSSTISHKRENSTGHKEIDCPISIQANNKNSLTFIENKEYQENPQLDGFNNSIKDLLIKRTEMEPLSCEVDIKESLLHAENPLDNVNIDVQITSPVHASQMSSSEEKNKNCFVLGSDGQVQEVIQENVWVFMDQFNSELDTVSNPTYLTPLQGIQPALRFSGGPQQSANKESIFFVYQTETERDVQMEDTLGQEGSSLQINSNTFLLTQSEDDDILPFDGNMQVSERDDLYPVFVNTGTVFMGMPGNQG
ncbi:hypothetical protein R5R35_005596 [Gryllus longicercus]|uniref:Uncharacterized protein n=1 Tax=Gryllus longicercus TaxID=2509291 RepID=A0AAN9V439_9ORTH